MGQVSGEVMSLVQVPGVQGMDLIIRPTYPLCNIPPKGRAEGFSTALPRRGRVCRTEYPTVRSHVGVFVPCSGQDPLRQQTHKMTDCCTFAASASELFPIGGLPLPPEDLQVVGAWLEFHKLGGLGLHKLASGYKHVQSTQAA